MSYALLLISRLPQMPRDQLTPPPRHPMLTTVAAPTTADAAASQRKLCAAGATCTHSQGPADLFGSIFESITDAVATTANDNNGEKVDDKDGNWINDQQQISDAENGRETFNNNKIESYERNGG